MELKLCVTWDLNSIIQKKSYLSRGSLYQYLHWHFSVEFYFNFSIKFCFNFLIEFYFKFSVEFYFILLFHILVPNEPIWSLRLCQFEESKKNTNFYQQTLQFHENQTIQIKWMEWNFQAKIER